MTNEEQVRRDMERAAAEHQLQPSCPVEENVDAAFGIKRTLRKIGAKVGLVKHPSKQTIGDIKRGKVGDNDTNPPPKRRK